MVASAPEEGLVSVVNYYFWEPVSKEDQKQPKELHRTLDYHFGQLNKALSAFNMARRSYQGLFQLRKERTLTFCGNNVQDTRCM